MHTYKFNLASNLTCKFSHNNCKLFCNSSEKITNLFV